MYKKNHSESGFGHLVLFGGMLFVVVATSLIGLRIHSLNHKSYSQNPSSSINTSTAGAKPTTEKKASKEPTSQTNTSTKSSAPISSPSTTTAFTTQIQIKGNSSCKSDTLSALRLLHDKAVMHYSVVTKYISIIECVSKGSGMYAYENPPRYVVGDATRNAGTIWYAGTIAHDAGHSKLYHDYLTSHPGQAVPDDIWKGKNAEVSCLDAQYDALSKIGATQSELNYVKNIITSQYYNIPYSERWW